MNDFSPRKIDSLNSSIQKTLNRSNSSEFRLKIINESVSSCSDDVLVFHDFDNNQSSFNKFGYQDHSSILMDNLPLSRFESQPAIFEEELFSVRTVIPSPSDINCLQIPKTLSSSMLSTSQSFSNISNQSIVEAKKKGKNYKFSEQEDEALCEIKENNPTLSWRRIAEMLAESTGELPRTADEVMQHFLRVINPKITKGQWTDEQDEELLNGCKLCPPKEWREVARYVPGRIGSECCYRIGLMGQKFYERGLLSKEWL